MNQEVVLARIEKMVYVMRGQRVMLDSDLAELYGVETKMLNQAVRRNISRFPEDFMFQPNFNELGDLRSQFVTANRISIRKHMSRTLPYLFTENGEAMLSTVLNSECAVQVNIAIMRIFTRLRSFLMLEKELGERVTKLEKDSSKIFKIVFERLDSLDTKTPTLNPNRKKIGLDRR